MPRKKVEMKLLADVKKRKTTFKNRSDGLVAKAEQLSILCGCDVLFICYDPTAGAVKTWPEDPEKVRKLISKYRDVPPDRFRQALTPLTFNEEGLKKTQDRFIKVQQCGVEELGLWDRSFDDAPAANINALIGELDQKMQRVQQRMAGAAVFASPVLHAMSLPPADNTFLNFGGGSFSSDTAGSTVTTQYYERPHQMLPQPFPFQPVCHGGYQMAPPFLSYHQMTTPPSYQMPPLPYLSYNQMPPEFGVTGGYAMNVANNGASAASEFYGDGLMQDGFDASGAGASYVGDDVLGQAFSAAGPPSGVYHLAQNGTVGVWPVISKTNDPVDSASFQLMDDHAGLPGTGSCTSSTSYQGGFEN